MDNYEGVEDTLFIPLTARINISKRFPEYFYDKKALEMEYLIKNSSIEKKSSEYTLMASVSKNYNLDEITQTFIDKHEKCNIVNLGVGLETSYFRLNRKDSLFYEVDLPEVIDLRQKYIKAGENEKYIKGDLFELEWCNELDTTIPTLMIASGVFQYFHEKDILSFIENIKRIFEKAELVFDATNKFGIKYSNIYVKRTGNKSALMYFYIKNPKEFAKKCNCELIECRGFYKDALGLLSKKLGIYTKISMKIADRQKNAMIITLKIS
ncbi:MAG: class I SAM-dependent methyltransferase [Methanosphaera sp.]|nr:class I SAM-dependent methyltransferase [Methanosphaera sp.]